MARRCELTGTEPQFGHNVAHSNVKTNRRFNPNLQKATFFSDSLRRKIRLRVTTRAIRTVQKIGSFDGFLLGTSDAKLAPEALRLKRQVKKAMTGKLSAAAAN
jgi:large subunit ribosomal protein L28